MAWIFKRGGKWWVGFRTGGQHVRRSLNTADRAAAEKERAKIEMIFTAHASGNLVNELVESLTGRKGAKATMYQTLTDWLAETATSTAPGTLRRYKTVESDLRRFFHVTETTPMMDDVTPDEVRRFLLARTKEVSVSTANMERKIVSIFFGWALKNSIIKSNPVLAVRQIKGGKDEEKARRGFTAAEAQLLLKATDDPFWRYMIIAGFFTGQRLSDLVLLHWGSVDFAAGMIRLTTRKTSTLVQIPMAAALRKILWERHQSTGGGTPSDYVWPAQARQYEAVGAAPFSNGFAEIMAKAGMAKSRKDHSAKKEGRNSKRELAALSFHSLRHGFVSLLRAAGATQAVSKALVGHAGDEIHDAYTHLPEATLRTAVETLPIIDL